MSLFIGSVWILSLGIIDDRVNLGWRKKLLGQILGIGIVLLGGHTIGSVDIPFYGPVDFGPVGYPLLGFIVLLITNAVNLIDGHGRTGWWGLFLCGDHVRGVRYF